MSKAYYEAPLIVTYSGGKDSDVMLHLAESCLKPDDFEVMNSHTTVDAPETVRHIRKVFKRLDERGVKTRIDYHEQPDGCSDKQHDLDHDYAKGLEDAWECARKIGKVNWLTLKQIGFEIKDKEKNPSWDVVMEYSASEAIAKIKEYEENQKQSDDEIKVGDEIYSLDKNYKSVVTAVFDTCRGVTAVYFTQNGKWCGDLLENLHKTGRHFPQITEVLKQMQEG